MNGVNFEDDTFVLVIDTNSLTFDFERQLASYTTGHYDDRHYGRPEQQEFLQFMEQDKSYHSLNELHDIILYMEHDDFDKKVSSAIWDHPDWPGEFKSIAFFLEEQATSEMIDAILMRVEQYQSYEDAVAQFQVLGVRQFKVEIQHVRTVKVTNL